jgi:hypothetical protein
VLGAPTVLEIGLIRNPKSEVVKLEVFSPAISNVTPVIPREEFITLVKLRGRAEVPDFAITLLVSGDVP